MVVGDKKKHLAVILTLKSLVDDNNQVSTNDYTYIDSLTNLKVEELVLEPKKVQEFENVLHRGPSEKLSFYCKNYNAQHF